MNSDGPQYNAYNPSRASPLSREPTTGVNPPQASYDRVVSGDQRQGRSPLARQNYVHTAPGEGIELQAPQHSSLMRDVSPAPLGQHERSDSADRKRKRLSKQQK
jgi:chitin synthase